VLSGAGGDPCSHAADTDQLSMENQHRHRGRSSPIASEQKRPAGRDRDAHRKEPGPVRVVLALDEPIRLTATEDVRHDGGHLPLRRWQPVRTDPAAARDPRPSRKGKAVVGRLASRGEHVGYRVGGLLLEWIAAAEIVPEHLQQRRRVVDQLPPPRCRAQAAPAAPHQSQPL